VTSRLRGLRSGESVTPISMKYDLLGVPAKI
jgi:hypothetical protein